jgi:hypothetical protein
MTQININFKQKKGSKMASSIKGGIIGKVPKFDEFQKIVREHKRKSKPRIDRVVDTVKGYGQTIGGTKAGKVLGSAGKGMGGALKKVYSKSPLGVGIMGGLALGALISKKKDPK